MGTPTQNPQATGELGIKLKMSDGRLHHQQQ